MSLINMLAPNFTSFSVFLPLIRKSEVFSVAIGVNCDEGANYENPWDSKARKTFITYCANMEHGWSVSVVHFHPTALNSC